MPEASDTTDDRQRGDAAPDAAKAAGAPKADEAAPPAGERPPMPDPETMTRLHETLPAGLPKTGGEGDPRVSAATPGTLPEDSTQATDPGAARPGTPGVD